MDVDTLRNNAYGAAQTAATMTASLPKVLTELKGSLNEIFNKDNPLVKERTGYLENYLAAPDKARAEYLPQNSGQVYSPTELNALVSSRKASALAPLASVNQMLMGQYGGLKDYLGQAKETFQASVAAAAQRAEIARQMYGDEVARRQQEFENKLALDKFNEEKRQFDLKLKGSGGGGLGGINLGGTPGQKPPPYVRADGTTYEPRTYEAPAFSTDFWAQPGNGPVNTTMPSLLPGTGGPDWGRPLVGGIRDFASNVWDFLRFKKPEG